MINSAEFFHGILKPHVPEVTLLVEELVQDGQSPGCALEIAFFLLRIGTTSPETIETVANFARAGAAEAVQKFRSTKG